MRIEKLVIPALMLLCSTAMAQKSNSDVVKLPQYNKNGIRTNINIPDIPGYTTLKCDFHIHTVFSDGSVWPSVRVSEAWKNGLDVIAITDHLEWRPKKDQVLGDHNEAFKIAKVEASNYDLIVVKGAEITRSKPLGHLNALFITDANPLDVKDPLEAIDIARSQGAFIMWNHPGWPDDKSTLYPIHETLIKEGKINGIEIVNDLEYYPKAITWCKDFKLAYMGNSDIHGLIHDQYGSGIQAPITLVFAKYRSESAVKEALMVGRSAVMFNELLFGPREILKELCLASLKYTIIKEDKGNVMVEVKNISDIDFKVEINDNQKEFIPANKTVRMSIPYSEGQVKFVNCWIAEGENLVLSIPGEIN